jgi:hypothetical protein
VRALGRRPWRDRADFAPGTSIGTSHWVLSEVLLAELRGVVEVVAGGFLKVQQANPEMLPFEDLPGTIFFRY